MNKIATLLLSIVLSISIVGCSTTMKGTQLNESGRFPTNTKLRADGVKVVKPFNDKYESLLYVRTDDSTTKQYKDFFITSFSNMKVFDRVVQKSDLETLVIEKNLTDNVSNISDLVGLNQLQKKIGSFLVVVPYVERKGIYGFMASLEAVDPETGETVLLLEQEAFNWTGLDEPLFYPLLNGFLEWSKGRQISIAPVAKN